MQIDDLWQSLEQFWLDYKDILIAIIAILIVWIVGKISDSQRAASATRTLLWLAVAGTLFSLYLTFLEPFVIGATCSWCLVSAILITALLWLSGEQATAT